MASVAQKEAAPNVWSPLPVGTWKLGHLAQAPCLLEAEVLQGGLALLAGGAVAAEGAGGAGS